MHNSNEAPQEDASMSARIKEARQARGWSQQELAERVSVSQPTIVHWEQGTHIPRHLALARLADALGVSRQWLQGDSVEAARSVVPQMSGNRSPNSTALDYLAQTLRHVPIFSGPLDGAEINACLRGERSPVGYLPIVLNVKVPIALRVDDPSIRREFPKGSVALIDCADKELVDGKYYLFAVNGAARLRRWGANPMRLEADNLEDVQFIANKPETLGCVVLSVRIY